MNRRTLISVALATTLIPVAAAPAATAAPATAVTGARTAAANPTFIPVSSWVPGTNGGRYAGRWYTHKQLLLNTNLNYSTWDSSRISTISIQAHLVRRGYTLVLDGYRGPATTAAVKDFQRKQRITVDGNVGPVTAQRLFQSAYPANTFTKYPLTRLALSPA